MNNIVLAGTICRGPKFSHNNKTGRKNFYDFYLEIKRKSGVCDFIHCFVTEEIAVTLSEGKMIEVYGEIRSRNDRDENGKRILSIFVYVNGVGQYLGEDKNDVNIHGYCVYNHFRMTPSGIDITDLQIASNRNNGKSDYIPAIAWNGIARLAETASVGTELEASGRLQSREYLKKLPDGRIETRVTYELSISDMDLYERN